VDVALRIAREQAIETVVDVVNTGLERDECALSTADGEHASDLLDRAFRARRDEDHVRSRRAGA
jgi:hypothetical protein